MKKTIIAVAISFTAFSVSATSDNGVQHQLDDLRAGLHQVHINTLGKYSESWGLEDRANIAKLQEQKVDKSVFTADQQRQDKALSDAVASQAATDAKQTSDLKAYADKKATSAYQTAVAHTDAKVARADADRLKGDTELQQQITDNLSAQTERDAGQDSRINAVQDAAQSANEKADAGAVRMDGIEKQAGMLDNRVGATEVRADKLEEGQRLQNAQMESDRKQRVEADEVLTSGVSHAQSRIDATNASIATNREALRNTNRTVSQHSAQLADHEQRLTGLEESTNRNFASLKKQVERNKKDTDAGIASVGAMASIPQVTEYQTFNVGVGVGSRHDQQAVAVGFSARASQNVVIKVSVASDTNSSWTLGAGAAIGW